MHTPVPTEPESKNQSLGKTSGDEVHGLLKLTSLRGLVLRIPRAVVVRDDRDDLRAVRPGHRHSSQYRLAHRLVDRLGETPEGPTSVIEST